MTSPIVLFAARYGPAIYEIVQAACPPELTVRFLDSGDEQALLEHLREAHFVIGGKLTRGHFQAAPRLKLLQCLGVGYDGIDLVAAREHGIMVATTPEATVEGVAEHVLLLMLAVNKQLIVADAATRRGEWLVWQLRPTSHRLFGQTVGLVGLGRIGREVARRAAGFGVRLVYSDPLRAPKEAEAAFGLSRLELDELLATSDVVSLHTPLTPMTRRLIGAHELAQMKPTAILINTSRGGVVDEAALIAALREGRIRGAGLDVFETEPIAADNPLLSMPQVVLTPHIATGTLQAMEIKAKAQLANCLRVMRSEPPLNRVA